MHEVQQPTITSSSGRSSVTPGSIHCDLTAGSTCHWAFPCCQIRWLRIVGDKKKRSHSNYRCPPRRALNRTEILSCAEREDPVQKEAWLHSDPWHNRTAAFYAICRFYLLIFNACRHTSPSKRSSLWLTGTRNVTAIQKHCVSPCDRWHYPPQWAHFLLSYLKRSLKRAEILKAAGTNWHSESRRYLLLRRFLGKNGILKFPFDSYQR